MFATVEAKLIGLGAALLVLLGVFLYVMHLGASAAEATAAKAGLARAEAAAEQHAANEHTADVATTGYVADSAARTAKQPETIHAIQTSLAVPAQCASAPTLAAVVVPRNTLGSLRSAGADRTASPDLAASAVTGAGLLIGAGLPGR